MRRAEYNWPADHTADTDTVVEMYAQGLRGCSYDEQDDEDFCQEVANGGGTVFAADVAHEHDFADSFKGKLVIPYVFLQRQYPDIWPGPGQQTGDCVSWSFARALSITMSCDVVSGAVDEVSGKREQFPEASDVAIQNCLVSSEVAYWHRGHGGSGWNIHSASRAGMTVAGATLRKNYPEIGLDLTTYSGKMAQKWGREKPPQEVIEVTNDHLFRTATKIEGDEAAKFAQVRDMLGKGFGIGSDGSEGWSRERGSIPTRSGAVGHAVAKRQGSWQHSMCICGADDRPETHREYGGPLVCIINSWGKFNRGPRDIPGTNFKTPEGGFWARWKDASRRRCVAFSGLNGWRRNDLPDLTPGFE